MPDPLLVRERADVTAEPCLPRPFRVTGNRPETSDVATIGFEPDDGLPTIRFRPAQIGMVGLPGLGEVPVSFSSDADDATALDMTIRAAGAITTALVATRPGDVVSMRGPYGRPWPLHEAHGRRLVIIAGGLGLAPLRAAVVASTRSRRFASVDLVHGARTPDDLLFRHDLDGWRHRIGVHLCVERPSDGWEGAVGVVSVHLDDVVVAPEETVVMMCGPDVMLRKVSQDLVARGVAPDRIWVTLERNMKCSVGLCGHCQLGPFLLCRDGPVLRYDRVGRWLDGEEM